MLNLLLSPNTNSLEGLLQHTSKFLEELPLISSLITSLKHKSSINIASKRRCTILSTQQYFCSTLDWVLGTDNLVDGTLPKHGKR
jgi:hypothetical protein